MLRRSIFRNIFIISRRYASVRTKLHDNNTLALCIIDYQRARISYAGNGSTNSHQRKCNCLFIRRGAAFFKLKFLLREFTALTQHCSWLCLYCAFSIFSYTYRIQRTTKQSQIQQNYF